jgi:hypothetical protein
MLASNWQFDIKTANLDLESTVHPILAASVEVVSKRNKTPEAML